LAASPVQRRSAWSRAGARFRSFDPAPADVSNWPIVLDVNERW
jgi:hypothetical protein